MKTGSELIGFVRGFFFAGTSSLVASLWKVDDLATKELMVTFYNHLINENMDVLKALRKTKITMLNSEKYSHPYFWAPFVLYGRGI